jgi:hypothetical protein
MGWPRFLTPTLSSRTSPTGVPMFAMTDDLDSRWGTVRGLMKATRSGGAMAQGDKRAAAARSTAEEHSGSRYLRSRADDDDSYSSRGGGRGHGRGGWFGDPEGHSRAAERAWGEGRRSGGWFGDSEAHSEASERAWREGRRPGGWYGDPEGHSRAAERAWEDGRRPGGWFGDSEGHSRAAEKRWEQGGRSRATRRDDNEDRSSGGGRDHGHGT